MAEKSQSCKKMKEVKEEKRQEEGNGNSSTDSVNSGSGPDYQIFIPLGCAPW
jgi:hypothetical protein